MPHQESTTRVKIRVRVRDYDGGLADPTTLECNLYEPDGTITTYIWGTDVELVRESVGTFYVECEASQSGQHRYRWQSGGVIVASFGGSFNVTTPRF